MSHMSQVPVKCLGYEHIFSYEGENVPIIRTSMESNSSVQKVLQWKQILISASQ